MKISCVWKVADPHAAYENLVRTKYSEFTEPKSKWAQATFLVVFHNWGACPRALSISCQFSSLPRFLFLLSPLQHTLRKHIRKYHNRWVNGALPYRKANSERNCAEEAVVSWSEEYLLKAGKSEIDITGVAYNTTDKPEVLPVRRAVQRKCGHGRGRRYSWGNGHSQFCHRTTTTTFTNIQWVTAETETGEWSDVSRHYWLIFCRNRTTSELDTDISSTWLRVLWLVRQSSDVTDNSKDEKCDL